MGGGWANAVFENNLYVERDLYTPADDQWYTWGEEPQQQLIRTNNKWSRTFSVRCDRNVHIGLW
jgi:hypothetical protein